MEIIRQKQDQGITLIALVITIIVLLILAGVTISMIIGQNGIFGKTNTAKEVTQIQAYKEELELMGPALAISKYVDKKDNATIMRQYEDEIRKSSTFHNATITSQQENGELIITVVIHTYTYKVTEKKVQYIGKSGQITIQLDKNEAGVGEVVKATITQTSVDNSINLQASKWEYNTTSANIGTDESSYTGGNFSSNPQTIDLTSTLAGSYYLHVLTVDSAGHKKETISSPITIKTLAEDLATKASVGQYVNYQSSGTYAVESSLSGYTIDTGEVTQVFDGSTYTGKWRILSKTADTVTIISDTSVSDLTLHGQKGSTNSITILHNIAQAFLNNQFAQSARHVGSNPSNPTDATEYELDLPQEHTSIDINAMQQANTLNIGKNYWLSYRAWENGMGGKTYHILKTIDELGEFLNSGYLYYTSRWDNSISEVDITNGVRPIITLKTGIKTDGGDGSESSPYTLVAQ